MLDFLHIAPQPLLLLFKMQYVDSEMGILAKNGANVIVNENDYQKNGRWGCRWTSLGQTHSNSGFSVLPKDAVTCRLQRSPVSGAGLLSYNYQWK